MTAHSNTHPETDALRILSFESRRADDMAGLIERHGGVPLMVPSMREVPLEDNTEAIRFADRLLAGEIDIVVLLTGVGLRTLVEAVAQHHPADRLAAALGRVTTISGAFFENRGMSSSTGFPVHLTCELPVIGESSVTEVTPKKAVCLT